APEYRFRHGLVQEVAYARLVETRRRHLHRVVGEALEHLHRDALEEIYGLLAWHFTEADEPARAVDYLLKAGDAARAVYGETEAVELYNRALAFMERAGETETARQTLFKIALTHHLTFDFGRASEAYGRAFKYPQPAPRRLEPTKQMVMSAPAAMAAAA